MELEVKNISKKFDKKNLFVNITFEVNEGEIVSLVGRNGSGKTTLLKLITGIYKEDSGKIMIDGRKLEENNLKSNLIYIPDKFDYFKNTRIKNIIFYYELAYPKFDKEYFFAELKKNKISATKRISELSKGQATIFSILLGLACKTKFLLLDEPLDGIDILNIKVIIDYIIDAQDNGVGLLLSSHRLDYVENISDKIIYLDIEKTSATAVNKEKYSKYQLVYEEEIPDELLKIKELIVINKIGRVCTVIAKGDEEEVLLLIKESNPLQYDSLPVLLEDIFILNNKGGEDYE